MQTIADAKHSRNTQANFEGEIIVLGPTWRDRHPLTVRLLCDLKFWGWSLTRDSQGRYYAMCHASHTEGQG